MADRLTLGSLIYKLGFQNEKEFLNELERVFDKGEKEATESGKKAGKGFTGGFKTVFAGAGLGSFVGTIFGQMFSQASAAASQFARESVRSFATYEQGLVQLRLAGVENIGAVEARIKSLSETSKVFSVTDISLALGDLVKAGYDVDTALGLVERSVFTAGSSVDATTLQFADLGQTSVQLGNILRALGLDVSDTARVTDVLARAAQDSNLDVTQLVDIVAEVGPTAKTAGIDLEFLASMAAQLSNRGARAGEIGTMLRAVISELINPTGTTAEQFDRLGISLLKANGESRDAQEVLRNLNKVVSTGGEGIKLLAGSFDTFALSAVTNLAQASDAVIAYDETLQNAEGSAENLFEEVRDSGAGAFADMQRQLDAARVSLGEQLMPTMIELYEDILPPTVDGIEATVEALDDLIDGLTDAANIDKEDYGFFTWLGETMRFIAEETQGAFEQWQRFNRVAGGFLGRIGLGPAPSSSQPETVITDAGQIVPVDSPEGQAELAQRAQAERSANVSIPNLPLAFGGEDTDQPPPTTPPPRTPPPPPPSSGDGGSSTSTRTPRTPQDVFNELATAGTAAQRKAAALGNTVEARMEGLRERINLVDSALDELLTMDGTDKAQVEYLVGRLGALNSQLDAFEEKRRIPLGDGKPGEATFDPTNPDATFVPAPRAPAGSIPKLEGAEIEVPMNLVVNPSDFDDRLRRLREQVGDFFASIEPVEMPITVEPVTEPGFTVVPLKVTAEEYNRATGAIVRLTQAKIALGKATGVDLYNALRAQLAMIRQLIPRVEVGSEKYFELARAIQAASDNMRELVVSGALAGTGIPVIGFPGSEPEPTGRSDRINFRGDLPDNSKEKLSDLEQELSGIALSLPRAIVSGIKDGDLGGALEDVFGNASDFFLDKMITGLLGPVADSLAKSLAGAIGGPLVSGLFGIGFALLGSLFGGGAKEQQKELEQARRNGASSIDISVSTAITVNTPPITDPAARAQISAVAEETTRRVLKQIGIEALLKREKGK